MRSQLLMIPLSGVKPFCRSVGPRGGATGDAVPVRRGRDGMDNRAGALRRVMPIVCCVVVMFAGFRAPGHAAVVDGGPLEDERGGRFH